MGLMADENRCLSFQILMSICQRTRFDIQFNIRRLGSYRKGNGKEIIDKQKYRYKSVCY